MRRYRNVPPIQFLQGFEAASRLGSFSKAAKELGLSQSAVSHEMRLLEQRLGQLLFLRIGRTVHLTDAGRVYQRTVREAHDELDAAQQKLEPFRRMSRVVIYTPRDFGRCWLLPKFGSLLHACPQTQPWLDTSGAELNSHSTAVSIGIVYASHAPQGAISIKLADDNRAPRANPSILKETDLPDDLIAKLPLIFCEGLPGWDDYFADDKNMQNVWKPVTYKSALDFSDFDAALVAAEAGLGAVLASVELAATLIEGKRLAPLTKRSVNTGKSWFATTNSAELENPHTASVWNWFKSVGCHLEDEPIIENDHIIMGKPKWPFSKNAQFSKKISAPYKNRFALSRL